MLCNPAHPKHGSFGSSITRCPFMTSGSDKSDHSGIPDGPPPIPAHILGQN